MGGKWLDTKFQCWKLPSDSGDSCDFFLYLEALARAVGPLLVLQSEPKRVEICKDIPVSFVQKQDVILQTTASMGKMMINCWVCRYPIFKQE